MIWSRQLPPYRLPVLKGLIIEYEQTMCLWRKFKTLTKHAHRSSINSVSFCWFYGKIFRYTTLCARVVGLCFKLGSYELWSSSFERNWFVPKAFIPKNKTLLICFYRQKSDNEDIFGILQFHSKELIHSSLRQINWIVECKLL